MGEQWPTILLVCLTVALVQPASSASREKDAMETGDRRGRWTGEVVNEVALRVARDLGRRTEPLYHQTRAYVSARSICLQAAGVPNADYETLMTVSGYGTGFAYHPTAAWLTYQPATVPPWETQGRLEAATGRRWVALGKPDTMEAAWSLIVTSLDRGLPVLGFHFMGEHVIVGYRGSERLDERQILLCCPFRYEGAWTTWGEAAKLLPGNPMWRVGGECPATPARELAVQAMRDMVAAATADGRAQVADFPADAAYGLAGIEAFAADVAGQGKAPEEFDAGWLGCHAAFCQISGRRAAADYLRRAAALFGGNAERLMVEAAEAYAAAFESWREWGRLLGTIDAHRELDEVKALWRDPAARARGAQAIRSAAEYESRAVQSLQPVLATEAPAP